MSEQSLWLLSSGKDKLQVIKIINNSTNHGLKESKRLVENTPSLILTDESWKLKSVEKQLVSAGCSVEYRDPYSINQNDGDTNSYEKMADDPLIKLAEGNDPDACIELSIRYRSGTDSIEENEQLADYWLNRGRDIYSGIVPSPHVAEQVGKTMPNVKKILLSRTSDWFGETNIYDCLYNQIPEKEKNEARQGFGIGFDEDIIFIRDTGWFNKGDQGLVITDKAIYCIPDNDKPEDETIIPWAAMQGAEYKDLVINIYASFTDGSSECPIPISYFTKSSDESKQASVGRQLAPLLTKVCKSFQSSKTPYELIYEEYQKISDSGKNEEALQYALNAYSNQGNSSEYCLLVCDGYRKKGDFKRALSYCDEFLSYTEVGSPSYVYGLYLKESIYGMNLGDYIQSRKFAFLTTKYATDERANDVLIKEDAKNDFNVCEEKYVEGFLDLPYNQRKILMPVREYVDLSQNHISVIDIK